MFGASFLPRVGGMEYVIHHLSNSLVRLGEEVTVIAERTGWGDIGVEHAYRLRRYGLPVRGYRKTGMGLPAAIIGVLREHRRRPFDVLHTHGVSYAGHRAAVIRQLTGIPLVMTPHGMDIQRVPDIGYGLRLDDRWNRRIGRNLASADAVTAISRSIENELDQVDKYRIFRIPNGIFTEDFGSADSDYLYRRLEIPRERKIILSVGRNHVKKGYRHGILAAGKLLREYGFSGFHYVIAGRGVSEHARLVERQGLSERVSLIEEVPPEQIRECYRSSRLFFSPSVVEGLSLVSIEAIACGLPLVVTDVPGNADIVMDTGCGMIVKSGDTDDMARGLYELLSNEEKMKRLGAVAIEQSANYHWDRVAERYLEVYRHVIEGKRAV
jgi:glycosyltransferase involved in cell wall biosynthesis